MCQLRRLGNRLTTKIKSKDGSVLNRKVNSIPFKHRFRPAEPVRLKRSPEQPYERHLLPDFEDPPVFEFEERPDIIDAIQDLPVFPNGIQ